MHILHTFDKPKQVTLGLSAPAKMEISSSSTKSMTKGLTQKQREILEVLKHDLAMRQIFLQKVLDKENSDDDSSSAESSTKPKAYDLQDL